ncbi:MAG: hypothetical protein ACOC2K_02475 [Bacteroidota bacterium]
MEFKDSEIKEALEAIVNKDEKKVAKMSGSDLYSHLIIQEYIDEFKANPLEKGSVMINAFLTDKGKEKYKELETK